MPTIVSITELPLAADSRALKIAASFARAGYRSIVVDKIGVLPPNAPERLEVKSIGEFSAPMLAPVTAPLSAPPAAAPSATPFRLHHVLPESLNRALNPVRFALEVWRSIRADGLTEACSIPKADLYYVHGPTYSRAVRLRAGMSRAPIIYDAHDYYQLLLREHDGGQFYQQYQVPYYWRREAALIRAASEVITVSFELSRLLRREFGCSSTVIRNCHDTRLDGQAPAFTLKSLLGLSEACTLVACIGHWKPGFATDAMFEVLERLPTDVALVVIGKGWEESLQTAAARRLKDRFHWCPAVPATEVVPLLSTADIAWLPHRAVSEQYRAALPNGFFQSIAAGLPTIFSSQLPECVALSEMTGAGVPANPDDLASVCHVIMELVRKPRAKGNNEILTWAAEEKQLLPIVTRLLRGNV